MGVPGPHLSYSCSSVRSRPCRTVRVLPDDLGQDEGPDVSSSCVPIECRIRVSFLTWAFYHSPTLSRVSSDYTSTRGSPVHSGPSVLGMSPFSDPSLESRRFMNETLTLVQ